MSKINDGGPAFPQSFAMSPKPDQGMTLRDYFAAKAMQGFAADPEVTAGAEEIAKLAYTWADAMLAAREKGGAA